MAGPGMMPPPGMPGMRPGMPGPAPPPPGVMGRNVANGVTPGFNNLNPPNANNPVVYADPFQVHAVRYHGTKSHPLWAEEAHLGWDPNVQYFDEFTKEKHPLDPTSGLQRTIVKLPHPRYHGSPEFIDGIPKKNATFAWTEICGTREPECSMAPQPQVQMKQWYNTYVYVPEQRSHVERQYLERYVPGPDGEWIDVVKARRMATYLEEQRMKALQALEEQRLVASGDAIELTDYVDQYTGEHLVACEGKLMSKNEVYQRYDIHRSDWGRHVDQIPAFDFDNLRVPWIFGKVDRNKRVSAHAYEWFDRRNPRVVSDRSYKMMELPSYYVDEDLYQKWRAYGHDGIGGLAEDVATRAKYLDDYPYKM